MATSTRQGTDRVGSRLLPMLGRLLVIALLTIECTHAAIPPDAQRMLAQAEEIKISDPQRFAQLLDALAQSSASLPRKQREHLEYLQAWKLLYSGNFRSGLSMLQALIDNAEDVNVRGRALATVVNAHAVASNYEQAFPQLNRLLDILPALTD